MQNFKDFVSQRLQNGGRRVGERADQGRECGVLYRVIRWTPWTILQLFRAEDRFKGAGWKRDLKRKVSIWCDGRSHVSSPSKNVASNRAGPATSRKLVSLRWERPMNHKPPLQFQRWAL